MTPRVLLMTAGAWYLPHSAHAFAARDALAGLWITGKSKPGTPPHLFRRCRIFQAAMMPFFRWSSETTVERAFYALFPLWKMWLAAHATPGCNVVQAMMGFATEAFDRADKIGALKVVDCPNSHPVSYYGYWQRECDLWCPGDKVPIPQRFFARMNRELERADVVLCPSTFVRDTMLTNGIPASKCFVNPFGVDTSVFKFNPSPPETPRFICVGTICLRKGYQYLFRAFERVKQQLPAAELICVGPYKADFRKERPRWERLFRHYPNLAHAELAVLLQQCTAFTMASLEEGFARVLSEAMAAGLPIIATHESGASTVVQNGVQGVIVPIRDPARMASAMIELATDAPRQRTMRQAAHEKGTERNTWQDYGDRLLAEYQRRLRAATAAAKSG